MAILTNEEEKELLEKIRERYLYYDKLRSENAFVAALSFDTFFQLLENTKPKRTRKKKTTATKKDK